MNQIKHKLQSKRGASLLIAMVYLIFAVFIGGSVLAAASANGYRIEHLSDQQEYLDQRSAAMLLAEEMDVDTYADVSLDVRYATTVRQDIIFYEGGRKEEVGSPRLSYTLTFKCNTDGKMDALRRVMFETAVLRYLEENDMEGVPVYFQNFVYDNGTAEGETVVGLSQFWTADDGQCTGTMHITGIKNGATFTDFTARYRSGVDENLYDFIVDFGDYSQLTVTMNGYSSIRVLQGTASFENSYMIGPSLKDEYTTRVNTQVERTIVSWNSPIISKGGTE